MISRAFMALLTASLILPSALRAETTGPGTPPAASAPTAPSPTEPSATPAAPASPTVPPEKAEPSPPAAATASAPPDPSTFQQSPAPVSEQMKPLRREPRADVGPDAGIVWRPARTDSEVQYGTAWAVGAHVRVEPLSFLAARVHTRFEGQTATFSDRALGLPSGTSYDQPTLRRVLLGISAEPTWKPIPELSLFAGLGVSWARTTAGTFHSYGAETVVMPVRAAVFVEFPLSLGVRYEVVPRLVAVSALGAVSFLTNQSGNLLRPYDTPGADGKLRIVGGFPEFGTSVALLAGVSLLL